jgi:hypothetical protein
MKSNIKMKKKTSLQTSVIIGSNYKPARALIGLIKYFYFYFYNQFLDIVGVWQVWLTGHLLVTFQLSNQITASTNWEVQDR